MVKLTHAQKMDEVPMGRSGAAFVSLLPAPHHHPAVSLWLLGAQGIEGGRSEQIPWGTEGHAGV